MIAQPGPCNIEVRDMSLSQEEFLKRYILIQYLIININLILLDVHSVCPMLGLSSNTFVYTWSAQCQFYHLLNVHLVCRSCHTVTICQAGRSPHDPEYLSKRDVVLTTK